MTHHYQYDASLPHSRKKLNAAFTHRLKKLCGRVYHLRVVEMLANDEFGDYLYVLNKRADSKQCILDLCAAYGIGKDYIDIYPNEDMDADEGEEFIQIYLSKPKPTAED